jgi:hypothetical protein
MALLSFKKLPQNREYTILLEECMHELYTEEGMKQVEFLVIDDVTPTTWLSISRQLDTKGSRQLERALSVRMTPR